MEKKSTPPPKRRVTPAPAPNMFEGAATTHHSRAPFVIGVGVLVAAGIALWVVFGGSGDKKDEPPRPPEQAEKAAPQKPGAPAPGGPAPAPVKPEASPDSAPQPEAKPPTPAVPAQPAGLTADQVRKKLDENKGALQGCIDEALRRDPNLRVGKIHIATTIAPSGAVTSAKIDKATVDQSPLGSCLKRATRRIAFPGFSGDAFDVDIPIVVTAGE